jgi:hypothetical protein
MRFFTAPLFWFGRVSLWLLFFPLGLWRSIRHGKKQSERRQAKLLAGEMSKR